MMRLPKPEIDIDDYISAIVQERQNGVNAALFAGLEAQWKQRCHAYEALRGDGAQIPIWPLAQQRSVSFVNLYSSPGDGAQSSVIGGLRDRSLKMCPMCGEAGTPNTLDHYLPEGIFPDFAILAQNLVPACDICQGHKLQQYQEDGSRLFLHPYYDDILQIQVLRLTIQPPYNSPSSMLTLHPDAPVENAPLVHKHLGKLNLQHRFQSFFRTDFLRVLKLVNRVRIRGQNVQQKLHFLQEHHADRSVNCWEHILYEGITTNHDLMHHLINEQLPPYLSE